MVSLNKDKNYGTVPQLHHRQVLNNNIKDRQVNDPNGSKRPAPANLDSSKARVSFLSKRSTLTLRSEKH